MELDPTISVSKGCFLFKSNSIKTLSKNHQQRKKLKNNTVNASFLHKNVIEQIFYKNYKKLWNSIDCCIYDTQNRNCIKIIENILEFIDNSENNCQMEDVIPTVALLTGINQPDHLQQFKFLLNQINNNLKSDAIILQSRDCTTLKSTIETMVYEFIENESSYNDNKDNNDDLVDSNQNQEDDDDDDNLFSGHKQIKRSQCNMQILSNWYESKYSNNEKSLIIILPDFECFSIKIIEDFILILNSYLNQIPFILIIGIATSISYFNEMLSYRITSKMRLRIFQFEYATNTLNQIIENVILSPKCPFHLSGKIFQFLCDIFLFYDFSINGFIQGYKYCMMEHFLQGGNAFSLCTNYDESIQLIKKLNHNDLEIIRSQLSFRLYIESIDNNPKYIIEILTDDNFFKNQLQKLLKNCHIFFIIYRYFIEFFIILFNDLPKTPLGHLKRELYSICIQTDLIELKEFQECWKILSFLSKNEFIDKLTKSINSIENYVTENTEKNNEISEQCAVIVRSKMKILKDHLATVMAAGTTTTTTKPLSSTALSPALDKQMTRLELKEKLLNMSKQDNRPISDFMKSINNTLDYIKNEIIEKHLPPLNLNPNNKNVRRRPPPLYELFVFSDLSSIRRNIVGAPRGALHTALNNPNHYLQCECCYCDSKQMNVLLSTMPDISIIYKLHLECGRMINLFDWLQAFKSIVDDNENDEIDVKVQARFTRAIAELQFLGYIKTSKRKTDHATRLTW